MGNNYKAWELVLDDFHKPTTPKDKLCFLLNFAVLAPSSHNSQPWKFKIDNGVISVALELSRLLPHSDSNNRQAYMSLGCAVENILIAADYYNHEIVVIYPDRTDWGQSVVRLAVKKLEAKHGKLGPRDHLANFISRRVSNRNPYKLGGLPLGLIEALTRLDTDGIKIFIVQDGGVRRDIANVAVAASIEATGDKGFRQELSRYVVPNKTGSCIGMPGFGFGMPTLVSILVPRLMKYVNVNKASARKDRRLLAEQTPALVVIASKNDQPRNWIRVGQTYERIALLAAKAGFSTAMWASPIQIGSHYQDLQKILQTNLKPQALFRLGCPIVATPHSPRLTSDQVLGSFPG
ncbi:MAG: hypothetical protein U9M92_00615 [Patescibacteria group bacterium]|nr:hypothetical protein [Patescibacteria group bacterium]